ncbi:hypothetical protein AVEN_254422-1 [Araneus ventricosus]|uniref:Uncharacterized protein n=1 Tax=Araneus ventricosus TaxID=182803 RepID=A0A4Y2M7S7_ARAVE|nr:hypothetical protein AVEN_254422-1 [Araneus ventricosus]
MCARKNSPTSRIMKNGPLFPNIQETPVAQVTGTIALVQISNANRQQFTSNNGNNTFRFNNTNSQQITNNDSNSTFNSAQLTDFPAHNADESPPSFSCLRLYSLVRLVVTSHGVIQYILYISFPSRDIEKMIAFSGIFDLSSRSRIQAWQLPVIPYLPL